MLSVQQGLSRGPSPDQGVALGVAATFLRSIGWSFTLNRFTGARGRVSHSTVQELAARGGRYVLEQRKRQGGGHMTALVNGEVRDIADCSDVPVYGWWTKARGEPASLPPQYFDMSNAFVPAR